MEDNKMTNYIKEVLENMPTDWLTLTTHRLDIYEEKLAKTQFLERFESMANANNAEAKALYELPTAFDYIRLGHPLSCVLEWAIAKSSNLGADHVISFSSQTVPVLAVLRKNLLDNKKTQINYTGTLPSFFEGDIIQRVYGYSFELNKVASAEDITDFEGSTIFIAEQDVTAMPELSSKVDFYINIDAELGSILLVNGKKNVDYIADIQHVRRRETIAMTPLNSLVVLNRMTGRPAPHVAQGDFEANKKSVRDALKEITGTTTKPLVGSSGLSIQYAIMMGIVHNSIENNKGKDIKIVVPTNCYGGTNDQARRVAACLDNVEVVDLAVDGGSDMVQSIDVILDKIAAEDAVVYIIAEIPTNPRVEVPELKELQAVLNKERKTSGGEIAVDPVFVLDQTFCPNIHFLGEGEILSTMRAISYASGSKFPSGGKCTAGYVVGNNKTTVLMEKINLHLQLCDNEATVQQIEILAKQLPSMNQRIADAYKNTRAFVNFIHETLPEAKINFVSEELASHGFTPSVFSLDLPTKGDTDAERESYKRAQNHKLINMMITEIPNESKYCVSYGQLKGCYWTIPATSTQGTTKEGDKDYIARVALSANMDMDLHKKVFLDFVKST